MSASEQVEALLLHQRAYRETSAIVDFITSRDQHIRVVCKGVRGAGKSASQNRAALQPFIPVALSYSGRSDLKSLRFVESIAAAWPLNGKPLFSALYINELVLRLCALEGAAPGVYNSYKHVIRSLSALSSSALSSSELPPEQLGATLEPILRQFEFTLLAAVGYGYDWQVAGDTGEQIDPSGSYFFDPQRGFVSSSRVSNSRVGNSRAGNELTSARRVTTQVSDRAIPGSVLLAISQHDYTAQETGRYAKLIVRQMLKPLLGDRPLKARELFG